MIGSFTPDSKGNKCCNPLEHRGGSGSCCAVTLSPCVHIQCLWKAAAGSSWRLAGTWIWDLCPWEGWDVMDKAEAALGREGGRADVPPRAEALLVPAVPEDPAPRGRWKREGNPVCGVLLAGHFPLTSVFAPLLIKTSHRAGQEQSSGQIPAPFSPHTSGLSALPWQTRSRGLLLFCAVGNLQKLKLYPSPSCV